MSAVDVFGTIKGGLGDCIVISANEVLTWRVDYAANLHVPRIVPVYGDLQGPQYTIEVLWLGEGEVAITAHGPAPPSVPVIGEVFGNGTAFLISVDQNGNVVITLIGGETFPVWSLDFVNNVAFGPIAIGDVEVVRSTTTLVQDSAGVWTTKAINVLAQSDLGAESVQVVDNLIRNPVFAGAVAGTPGTSPTNMTLTASPSNGITRSIVGVGVEDGITYMEVHYAGTATINTSHLIIFETTTAIPGVKGDACGFGLFVKRLTGSVGMTAPQIEFQGLTSGAAQSEARGLVIAPTDAGLGSQQFFMNYTYVDSTTADLRSFITFPASASEVVNATFRVGLPVFIKGSSKVPGNIVDRGADVLTIPKATAVRGGVEIWARAPSGINDTVLWSVGDAAADELDVMRDKAGFVHARSYVGGVAVADILLPAVADGDVFSVLFTWGGGAYAARLNRSGLKGEAYGAIPGGVEEMLLGSDVDGTQWNDFVRKISYFDRLVPVGGIAPVVSEWKQVGFRTRGMMDVVQATAGLEVFESRAMIVTGSAALSVIAVVFSGYYVPLEGTEVDAPNALPVEFYLEYNGLSIPGTFGGNLRGYIPPGAEEFVSDDFRPASWGLAVFPPGATFYVRRREAVATGESHLWNFVNVVTNVERLVSNDGSAASQIAATGPMVASGGWTAQTYQQLPLAFIGKSAAHDKAIVVHGDSISEGTGDAPFAANLGAMGGYIQRGLWSVNGRAFPHINLSRGGTRGVQLAVNFVKRRAMNKYVTHAIVAEGTNDAAVASWSEVAQAYRIICRTLEYDGVMNVYANQLYVRTTIDNLTNPSLMLPATGWATGSFYRDPLIEAMAAMVGTYNVKGVLDVNSQIEDATFIDVWAAPAGVAITGDGTHPNPAGVLRMAPVVTTLAGTF